MTDYSKGQIYCIRSPHTDQVYIGSTCQPLSKRMADHRRNYKCWNGGKTHYVSSFIILEAGDAYIELVEDHPCNSKKELNRREGQVMRETKNCCNMRVEGRTTKEYYKDNKQQILEQRKQYQQDNKEQIKEYQKQYYESNNEKMKEQFKKKYEDNKEKIKEKQKQRYQKNKEKLREKITCSVCNIQMNRSSKALHERTQKHKKNISN